MTDQFTDQLVPEQCQGGDGSRLWAAAASSSCWKSSAVIVTLSEEDVVDLVVSAGPVAPWGAVGAMCMG